MTFAAERALRTPDAPAGEPTRERLARALARHAGTPATVVLAVPAPVAAVDRVLAALPEVLAPRAHAAQDTGWLWAPPRGGALVASGACRRLEASGPMRLRELRGQVDALWARTVREPIDGTAAPPPRLLGGLAFAPASQPADPTWDGFADASLTLPRLCWGTEDGRGWIQLAVDGESLDAPERDRAMADVDRWLAAVAAAAAGDAPIGTDLAPPWRIDHLPPARWNARVAEIVQAIEAGRLTKVVAARRCALEHASPVDPRVALARLGERYPGCTRFAVRRGDATFLGATPERLVDKRGARVRTEAMAGSIARGGDAALLSSDKDRREHALVVEAVLSSLGPWCARLEPDTEPRIVELPNVLHLHTPIRARAREETHVLDLVGALHPTPAVGGVPRAPALGWIAEREQAGRGWYAGPIGWLDARGDGEMAVALRSGLVRGRRAWAWAGAGIVEGSSPEGEYAETTLKLQPLLHALGMPAGGQEDGGAP